MATAPKKVLVLLLLLAAVAVYVVIRLSGEPPPGNGAEAPGILERLLPPLPVPEPTVDLSKRASRDGSEEDARANGKARNSGSYAADLQSAADALLGPLDEGGGGAADLSAIKTRAAGDRSAAARAAQQAIRYLDDVARQRTTATANLARLETRTFRTFDDGDGAKKKAFFQAQARRRWDEYVATARPKIDRALAAVRAAE